MYEYDAGVLPSQVLIIGMYCKYFLYVLHTRDMPHHAVISHYQTCFVWARYDEEASLSHQVDQQLLTN